MYIARYVGFMKFMKNLLTCFACLLITAANFNLSKCTASGLPPIPEGGGSVAGNSLVANPLDEVIDLDKELGRRDDVYRYLYIFGSGCEDKIGSLPPGGLPKPPPPPDTG